jgi:uncharacterized membrane protein
VDAVTRFVRGLGRFWYDFVVGDDPKIAVGVAVVLTIGAVLAAGEQAGNWVPVVLAVLLGAAFAVSMLLDVSRSRSRS